ncbi:MAG: THUMP domain-containing protein [Candidatus Woesearchaeota archaeon]|nr:THUMP domain-containing protein [Candidatus Woesearchaeota archaeon]
MRVILIRYGEIGLKGRNRVVFENKLIENIMTALSIERNKIKKTSGRIILYIEEKEEILKKLKKIFGIVSISPANKIEVDIEKIKQECLNIAKSNSHKSFKISVQRLQKKLRPSPELEKEIGEYVLKNNMGKVKLKNPDLEIFVEIADNAYIFKDKIKCLGGLPVGIEGCVSLLLENIDSALAGILMMKRGCCLIPFYTEKKREIKEAFKLIREYGCFNEIKFAKNIKEIEEISIKNNSFSLVVNQTLKNLKEIKTEMVILRPLIGISIKEAKQSLCISI